MADSKITNYTTAFIKWKCAHCGKIEYRSTLVGAPYSGLGCKKGVMTNLGRGGHKWVKAGVVQNKPKGK